MDTVEMAPRRASQDKKEDVLQTYVGAPQVSEDVEEAKQRDNLETTHEGEFGTRRDLKPRVVSMIAIAGTIGTGLFLGSGSSLVNGGPVGFFLGYFVIGCLVGCMMYCLGEMTCYNPNIGGFIAMGYNYISPAFAFAMSINYILQTGLAIPAEISAIATLITYWDTATNHAPAFITVFLAVSVTINLVGVKYYGEVEFWFAGLKLLMLLTLVIFGLVADLGGVNHVFTGGKYWREEPFNDTFQDLAPVSKARFFGFWKVLTQAAFAFGGIEGIGVIAGEANNPRRTMRMAIRTVFYRIVGLYLLAVLIIGLNISQHSPLLLDAVAKGGATAASSPFVVICKQVGTKGLPSVINAVVMTSALSSCNENIYAVSRILLAMARQDSMHHIFLSTNRFGSPYWGVFVAFLFGLLAFLSVSSGSAQVFTWLSNLSALSSLICWISICACYVRFHKALRIQGINRRDLVLRSWFQPYIAYICIFMFTIILIFNGFTAFLHKFDVSTFFASYITLPVFGICYGGFWLVRRTRIVRLDEIDLSQGPPQALRGTMYDTGARY